jgi:hypothetical protein
MPERAAVKVAGPSQAAVVARREAALRLAVEVQRVAALRPAVAAATWVAVRAEARAAALRWAVAAET